MGPPRSQDDHDDSGNKDLGDAKVDQDRPPGQVGEHRHASKYTGGDHKGHAQEAGPQDPPVRAVEQQSHDCHEHHQHYPEPMLRGDGSTQ